MRQVIVAFTLLSLLIILLLSFNQASSFTVTLPEVALYYVQETAPKIGITNVIAAVNFDWRGFDTLGESTLLLTAAVGIRLILRRWIQRIRETGRA